MLVLSRKENEAIQIGDQIEITVISIEGSRIRLGISAPREISILRSELLSFGTDESAGLNPTVEFEADCISFNTTSA